ncbi:ComF family protein [Roseospirillum parvum]|uniref:ComF family protein n=1 Tax=Roseospirillum parvum TaxID=83401 RepID=A0A1G7VYV7_9PROT|nr:ComF family protein [Roseospirillum parvum]SDG64758.1 comF family protein [Roseospirillum parvum]
MPAPPLPDSPARRLGRQITGRLLDLLWPPRCLACRAPVASPHTLCAACFAELTLIAPPLCAACGLPFASPAEAWPPVVSGEALCEDCRLHRPPWGRARAALLYDTASRGLVLALKHADRTELAAGLAAWMARAGAEPLAEAELIVPVPLHRGRLFRRGYNQAALLAAHLARRGGLPWRDALIRTRPTPTQRGADRRQRRRNVADAFAVRRPELVAGRRLLLVDDVMTSGATAEAATRALLRAGAASVDVLTLARVPPPGHGKTDDTFDPDAPWIDP